MTIPRHGRPDGTLAHRTIQLASRTLDCPQSPGGDWTTRAACRDADDPDALFVQGAEQNRVKTTCTGCAVRTECLADALDNRVEFGVWGGMTERERRALLRRRPDVASWRSLLESARAQHSARVAG